MRKLNEYLNNIKLKGKFIGFALTIISLTVLIILFTSIYGSKKALEEQIVNGITNMAKLKAKSINDFYDRAKSNIEVEANSNLIKKYSFETENTESEIEILKSFNNFIDYHNYYRVSLTDKNHNVKISTDSYYKGKRLPMNLINATSKSKHQFSNSEIYKYGDINIISFMYALKDEYKQTVGYLCIDSDMSEIYDLVLNNDGLGETGESLIGMATPDGALFLSPLRYDKTAALKRTASFDNANAQPILEATQGKEGKGISIDYRGEEVIVAWLPIHSFQWGLVTKIDSSEAFQPIISLRNQLIFISLIIALFSLIVAIRFAVVLITPINRLRDAMIVIGQGNVLERNIKKMSNDEVGEMIEQANNLVDFQKNVIEFTKEIGKGNFNFESTHDISRGDLGKELLKMKESLQQVSEDEKKRNWATEGLAIFAAILRNNNDDLELLSDDIITNLVKYLGANQGGIFIISDDRKKPKMELKSAYAYDRKKFLEKEFAIGEGLIGQCWQEKEKIFLTEIPQAYINITSGLGTTNPTCILLMPLMINEDIYGVIEIASFNELESYQIEFIERLASSIASTLSSVKANLHTSSLLEESQQMSEELQAQEEELRQNAEEMQATQEEMERAQKELIKKEAGLRAIIDNSEDTIFAINTDYEIVVVNKKLKNKYKSAGIDLSIGRSILEVLPEDKKEFWKDRYDKAMSGQKYETIDEVAPGVMASVFHYPTYNENEEITGVAVVSRLLKSE